MAADTPTACPWVGVDRLAVHRDDLGARTVEVDVPCDCQPETQRVSGTHR